MTTITLNSDLEEVFPKYTNMVDENFLKVIKLKLPKIKDSGYSLLSPLAEQVENNHQGFLGFISKAYSNHKKIEIAPHDIWYLVMTEVAQFIKKNTEACRPLFTKEESSVTIFVPTDNPEEINLSLVIEELRSKVPVNVDLFVPQFSTLNKSSQLACYAAFCDGLQVYYNYMTFCCGIPEIRVTGTQADWQMMVDNFGKISQLFQQINSEFAHYLQQVQSRVAGMIENSFINANPEFWLDIYSKKNIGSGGEFVISGWITEFYFEKCELPKLENFASTISVVPYKNVETGRSFVGVNGAFKTLRTDDGFIKCGYEQFIFEVVKGLDDSPNKNVTFKV